MKISNKIRKYKGFLKGGVLTCFAYKSEIYMWVISSVITTIITILLWFSIYKKDTTITHNGLTFYEMLAYLITANMVISAVSATNTFYELGTDIREGKIAINLTKPINYRSRCLSNSFGVLIGNTVLVMLPIFIISFLVLHFVTGLPLIKWYNIILFVISIICSLIIIDSLDFIIGQVGFFTGALFGIILIKDSIYQFCSGTLIPLSFLPKPISTVFRFLPFSSINETPTYILLGFFENKTIVSQDYFYSLTGNNIPLIIIIKLGIQIFWAIALLLLSYLANKKMNYRVVSVGG